jgi:single-strand DNA-binding protein
MSMNSVNLIGRLGTDPELKEVGGKQLCKFRLAVDRGRDETDWFDVSAWDAQASACAQYLHKGSQVGVSGALRSRTWERDDGSKGYAVEVNAFRVDFIGPKQEGAAPAPQQRPTPQPGIDWTAEDGEDPFGDQ